MTDYTVTWQPNCEDDLAKLWLTFPDPQQITLAANEIDTLLRRNPLQHGVEVHAGFRVLTVPPLRIIFGVSEPDRLVRIWQVKIVPIPKGAD